jgi:predicted nucleotidyltransferase
LAVDDSGSHAATLDDEARDSGALGHRDVESGFVLVDAADALTIHRNTLVYRLSRISKHTGWPTSDRRHWLALYLACLADALSEESASSTNSLPV